MLLQPEGADTKSNKEGDETDPNAFGEINRMNIWNYTLRVLPMIVDYGHVHVMHFWALSFFYISSDSSRSRSSSGGVRGRRSGCTLSVFCCQHPTDSFMNAVKSCTFLEYDGRHYDGHAGRYPRPCVSCIWMLYLAHLYFPVSRLSGSSSWIALGRT